MTSSSGKYTDALPASAVAGDEASAQKPQIRKHLPAISDQHVTRWFGTIEIKFLH
jgi:hypothetical protein